MFTSRVLSDAALWPSATVTRFAVLLREVKFKFDACGRPVPLGNTVSRLDAASFTAVMLSTTAVAVFGIGSGPLGSPVTPVICSVRVPPGPRAPSAHWIHDPGRVSRIRKGVTGT